MSVAFRRDCDEEHLEPRFALPIPPGPNMVTARGHALIDARCSQLEQALAVAADEEARKPILRDLAYWRNRLASAQIAPTASGDRVAFGTRVTIVRDGRTQVIDIVGHDESDPAGGRLAFAAPLARALLGAEVGDEVDFAGSDSPFVVAGIEAIPD